MLNKYPLWKNLLVVLIVLGGALFALPNLFAPDPALQITGASSGQMIDGDILARAENALEAADIDFFGEVVDDNGRNALLRLRERDAQLRAQAVVSRALGDGFIVALNLAETTPGWLTAIGAQPMKLGLDLSGGVHFKLEVDIDAAVERRMEYYLNATKRGTARRACARFRWHGWRARGSGTVWQRGAARAARAGMIADLHFPELLLDRVDEGDDSDEWLIYARMTAPDRGRNY
jgi:preprotein translocase subunit SecD